MQPANAKVFPAVCVRQASRQASACTRVSDVLTTLNHLRYILSRVLRRQICLLAVGILFLEVSIYVTRYKLQWNLFHGDIHSREPRKPTLKKGFRDNQARKLKNKRTCSGIQRPVYCTRISTTLIHTASFSLRRVAFVFRLPEAT